MTNQNDPNTEKSEMLVMWIASAAIVLLILGAMGINMLVYQDTSTGSTETSNQSSTVPSK
jgi:flagellar basal body-associated protein FliL